MSVVAHAIDQARTTTVDGRFYKTGTSDPLLDTSLTVRLQILNPSKNCLIYEEEYTNVNTQVSDGYFKFSMGSVIGAAKRTANDPGFSMAKIYNNYLNSFAVSANCPSGYVPLSGDERFLRIVVVPSATGLPENLAPEIALTSVPSASVAESVQGLKRDDMLVRNTLAPAALDQGALEAIFNTTTLPVLNSVLDGTTSLYVRRGANGAQTLPSFAGNPASPGVGQIWYDTIDNEVKYWDGGPAPVVVGSGGGGGGPVSGNDITSGTITGTTAWNTSGNIATTGTITSSTSITVPQVSTREIFVSNLQPRTIKLQAPVSIVNPAGYTLTLPQDVPGTSGMALVGSNTGALSWQTIGLGTVTEVTAGTGLNVGAGPGGIITDTGTLNVNVGTTTGQIVQVAAGNKLPVIDGSNLTALSASNIAAGILPVNFGGTNNNSFLGNKIVGTNPTGTQLTNFTCTPGELITFDLSGNAGCSTIPTILGYTPANAATYVQKAGDTMTGTLNLASNGLVVGTNQLIVSGTNVGIGKTNPAEKLDVVGNIEATGTVKGSQLCIGSDCKNAWPVGGGGGSGTVTQVTAGTGLNVGAGPGGNFTTSGTLNIDVGTTNGKIVQVGPGNLLPAINASNLTSLNMNNAGSGTLAVARGGTGAGSFTPNKIVATNVAGDGLIDWSCPVGQMIKFDIGGMVGCDTIANILGYTPANAANYVLKAGDTMTGALTLPGNGLIVGTDQLVAGSGGVGIGTASPASQLHVSAVAPKFLIEDTQSGGKRWSIEEGSVAPATALQFRNATDNVTSMTLNENGFVGIGAGAASNRLVVGSDTNGASSNPGSTISIGNATSNSILTVGQSSTARGGMTWSYNATPASAYLHVGAVGTNSLALQLNGGNVGVGISSPTAALQLKAGTAGIGGAPLKFTAGTNTTAAEDGAMEFDGTDFWLTANGARKAIATSAGGGGSLSGISSISNASGSITMTPQSGGSVIINQTTISSTPSSGALVVNGGLGVGGAVNVQDSVSAASFTSSGGITAQTTTAATAGANQSSPNLALTANYWNGTASTVDRWTISNQMGTGTNPVSTLMFAHPAGTTGAKRIAFPAGSMVIGAQNPGAGKLTVDGGNILVRREDADSAVVLMTNSATANPNLILQRGQGDLTTGAYPNDGDTLGAISFRNSTDNTSNAAEIKAVAAGAHSASARGAGLQFTVTGSGGTTSNTAMTILSDGKVGVGTTSPLGSIQIHQSSTNSPVIIEGNDPRLALIDTTVAPNTVAGSPAWILDNSADTFRVYRQPNVATTGINYLQIGNSGAAAFPSGNLAVGTTTSTTRLTVQNAGNNVVGPIPPGWGGGIHTFDVYGNGTIGVGVGGAIAASMNSIGDGYFGGKVGIGTTTPSRKLAVAGDANGVDGNFNGGQPLLRIEGTTAMFSEPAIEFTEQSSAAIAMISAKNTGNGAGDLYLLTRQHPAAAPTAKMVVKDSGNVGIGTAAPSTKLQVAGTVTATSFSMGLQIINATCSNAAGAGCYATATCPAGKSVMSGGFTTSWSAASVLQSYPSSTTAWTCQFYSASALGPHTCYAMCANMQ